MARPEVLIGEYVRTDYHQEEQVRDALKNRFLVRHIYLPVLGQYESLDEILLFLVLDGVVLLHLVEDFHLCFIRLRTFKDGKKYLFEL